jgi:O-antigen/teichoic acid export membrane protein
LTDKHKLVSAAAWSIGAGLLGRGVGLIGTLLIARHLSPGIVAEVTVATIIALTGSWISAWGCGQYVIVRGGEGREAIFAASVFYLLFGVAVIAGLWWMAPTLAAWFATPKLAEYLPGALIGIGIRRLGAIPDKLLARELRFTRIALATALGDVAYALVAVTLVSTTRLGGQAMILGFIAQSSVIAALTIAGTGWRSWLTPAAISAARLRDIFRFGAPLTGEITLSEGQRYWDKPLMLRLLGAENAGAYGMAFNLAQLPAIYVGGHIGTVMMPAIVRAPPHERAPLIVRALALTAVVLFPMAFGLSVCASTLVAALLPPQWAQVAPLLSVLAAVSVLAPASFMLASFLNALGENAMSFRIELITVLVLVAALALLSRWGVVAASSAVGIALLVQLAISVSACRRHGLHLHGLGAPIMRVTAACMVMVAGVLLLRETMGAWQPLPLLRLGGEIAVGAVLYPAALAVFGNGLLQDVLRLLGASGKAELRRAALVVSPGAE